jgi:hypothetical protein
MPHLRRHRVAVSAASSLLLAGSGMGAGMAHAQVGPPLAADPVQTIAFIYNFGNFTEWPPSALGPAERPITLCMMGDTEYLSQALTSIENHAMQGRPLRVRHMSYLGLTAGCQILFISQSEQRHLRDILPRAHAGVVLTVSDIADFASSGGIVGLSQELQDNKLVFDINAGAARQAGLRLSSQVLKLARSLVGK